MILTHPSYDNIEFALKHIIEQLDKINYQPDVVIGLARGGLIPAVIVSHALNIKMEAVHYSSKTGKGDNKNHHNKLPKLTEYKRILCIDDIVDSGHTVKEVVDHYSKTHQIKTATLYYKEGSVIKPDLYWWTIPQDSPFITFPWERNIKYINY